MLNVLTPSLIFGIEPELNKKEASAGVSSEAMEALRAAMFGNSDTDSDTDSEEEPDLDALPDISEALGTLKQVLASDDEEAKAALRAELSEMIEDQE